jgi:hypothetical protein
MNVLENRKMFDYFEESVAERANVVPLYRVEPHLEEVRRDARFGELLSRINQIFLRTLSQNLQTFRYCT